MTVHLHIDRIVVEGLELGAHAGLELQETLRAELVRHFAAQDMAQYRGNQSHEVLLAPPVNFHGAAHAGALGTQAAQALCLGLGPGPGLP